MNTPTNPNVHLIGRKLKYVYVGENRLQGDLQDGDIFTVVDTGRTLSEGGQEKYVITVVNDRTDLEYKYVDIEDAFFAEENTSEVPLSTTNPWFVLLPKPGQEI